MTETPTPHDDGPETESLGQFENAQATSNYGPLDPDVEQLLKERSEESEIVDAEIDRRDNLVGDVATVVSFILAAGMVALSHQAAELVFGESFDVWERVGLWVLAVLFAALTLWLLDMYFGPDWPLYLIASVGLILLLVIGWWLSTFSANYWAQAVFLAAFTPYFVVLGFFLSFGWLFDRVMELPLKADPRIILYRDLRVAAEFAGEADGLQRHLESSARRAERNFGRLLRGFRDPRSKKWLDDETILLSEHLRGYKRRLTSGDLEMSSVTAQLRRDLVTLSTQGWSAIPTNREVPVRIAPWWRRHFAKLVTAVVLTAAAVAIPILFADEVGDQTFSIRISLLLAAALSLTAPSDGLDRAISAFKRG